MNRTEMAKKLSDLRHLKREVELLNRRIAEIEMAEKHGVGSICGMPKVRRRYDNIDGMRKRIAELETRLRRRREDCLAALEEIYRIIDATQEAQMRPILFLRYVDGRKWWEIAVKMEYSGEQIPRKKHNAFLEQFPKS